MAIFCLATNLDDLRKRIGKIVIGQTRDLQPVTVEQLNVAGAMTALLLDAFQPNLVQTLENNPALMHGGPFANIAHGCNSVMATKTALKLADYVVTEAGFGADLGAEKFFDIKCRKAGLTPDAVVLVATVKALKMHGGVAKADLAGRERRGRAQGLQEPGPAHPQHRPLRRAGDGGHQPLRRGHRGGTRGHPLVLRRSRRGLHGRFALGARRRGGRRPWPSTWST